MSERRTTLNTGGLIGGRATLLASALIVGRRPALKALIMSLAYYPLITLSRIALDYFAFPKSK